MSILQTEFKVLASLACILLALEGATRVFEERLSKDVGHLKEIPKLADDLAHPVDERAAHVLFLGNSMTRYGVDGAVFERILERDARTSIEWTKVNPDNTALADWVYIYRNFFETPEHRPDVIVLGFEGHHLQDAPSHHPNRLARFYCSSADWADLTHYDVTNFEQRMDYMVSESSALWANRDRVERRVLDSVIPGYREAAQEINVSQVQQRNCVAPRPTFHRLEEFLARAQRNHVKIVFAVMPLGTDYELEPELLALMDRYHTDYIDCRHIPGITRDMFPDGVHMTPEASKLYSRYLAHKVAQRPELVAARPLPVAARRPTEGTRDREHSRRLTTVAAP